MFRHSLRDQNDPELAVLDKKKDSDKQVEGNVANRVRLNESSVHVSYITSTVDKSQNNDKESLSQLIPADPDNVVVNDFTNESTNKTISSGAPFQNSDENEANPNVFDNSAANKNSELSVRVLSKDSSYQYDFYDHLGPPSHVQRTTSVENLSHNSGSPDSEHGSKLSYRLSENGYHIESSREVPADPYNQNQPDVSSSNDFSTGPVKKSDNRSNDDVEESENGSYQSSEDEFQRELASLVNKTSETEQESLAYSVGANNHASLVHNQENDVQRNKDDLEQSNAAFKNNEQAPGDLVSDFSLKSDTSPAKLIAVHSAAVSGAVIASSLTETTAENLIEVGQSRGDPDGMPTQRKINMGGNGKPALNGQAGNDPLLYKKKNQSEILKLPKKKFVSDFIDETLKPEGLPQKTLEKPGTIFISSLPDSVSLNQKRINVVSGLQ